MTIRFRIEYRTSWGEEIVLALGDKRIAMSYGEGGIWTAEVRTRTPEKIIDAPYHYEVRVGGNLLRREWKNRSISGQTGLTAENLPARLELADAWSDVPANAPFHKSAFSGGTFSVQQGEGLEAMSDAGEMYRKGWKC